MSVTIAVETPLQDEVRQLISELNTHLLGLFPPEVCSHLSVEQMSEKNTSVFIARADGEAVACGALRRHGNGIGEVKRMYTRPAHQGQGIAGRIVSAIEDLARSEGLTQLVLESGVGLDAAWHVYERAGFSRCGPVLHYSDIPSSAFYQKALVA